MSKNRIYIWWIISITLFLFSWAVSYIQPQFIYDTINTQKVSENIQKIIDKLEHKNAKIDEIEGLEYVLEKSDSIVYWSTNKIDFNALRQINKIGIYNLSSRIYLVWHQQRNSQKQYFLIPLKKNFKFENKYLRNTAFESVYFPKNYLPTNKKSKLKSIVKINDKTLNVYFDQLDADQLSKFWISQLFFLFVISLTSLLILAYRIIYRAKTHTYYKIGIWLSIMLFVRLIFIHQLPFIQYFYLFQPYDFANSFIPSLGMLMVNSVWVYTLVFYSLHLWAINRPQFNFFQSLILQLIGFVILLLLIFLIRDIITNSTSNFIDFDNVVLHYQDILLLLVFGVIILIYVKILLFILQHTNNLKAKVFLKYILILHLPLAIVLLLFDWHLLLVSLFAILSSLLISLKSTPYFSRPTVQLIFIFLGSVFVVSFVEYFAFEKELENSSLRLENYQTANNRLAEYLLTELDQKMVQDSSLLALIYRLPDTEQEIYKYIQMQYFTGFWSFSKSSDITICASNHLFNEPANNISNCKLFFDRKLGTSSRRVDNSHFVVINDYGLDAYLGSFHFYKDTDSTLIDLYIMLKPKEQHKNLGYPSILLSREVDNKYEQSYYSFAKYIDGQLVSHKGKYNYALENVFPSNIDKQTLVHQNGYYHLIEKQDKQVYNIISAKQQNLWTFFVILSYIFILYVGTFYFLEFLNLLIQSKLIFHNTLKNKLRLSFLGLLVLTFIIIAWAIISKSTDLSLQKQKNVLDEKMQSVLVELKHKLSDTEGFKDLNADYLNYLLIKFSNVFFTDINLYNMSGKLLASSRPEVFDKGLIGNRMNPKAFKNVSLNKKSRFIHSETIGTQNYLSAYIPFKNSRNESVAYLNLPYFAKDKEIKSDVATLVSAFLNIFVFLFLITGFFTVFISNRITLPLVIIQQKLKDFSLGGKNEPIVYKSNDEIGALVTEYNKTVEALNKNIELLSQKEREGAWKEMAKQIAHEIKNPLTPMKLSIQHLKYVWKDEQPDRDQKINDTVDLIVKQIDNLAEIASAFSDFSKMTIAQQSTFDLTNLIHDQINLYDKEAQIDLLIDKSIRYTVFADQQQILRVFQNIFSNAIQSVEEEIRPKIKIRIEQTEHTIITQICDNGKGMDKKTQERIFEPNFTTKNSGMGLGLAIVKQIVENNSGQIYFETEVDKGTCFSLELPKG